VGAAAAASTDVEPVSDVAENTTAEKVVNTLRKLTPVEAPAALALKILDFYVSDKAASIVHERDSSSIGIDNGRVGLGLLFN